MTIDHEFPPPLDQLTSDQIDLLLLTHGAVMEAQRDEGARVAAYEKVVTQLDRTDFRRKTIMWVLSACGLLAVLATLEVANLFSHANWAVKLVGGAIGILAVITGAVGLYVLLRRIDGDYRKHIAGLARHGEGCRCKACDPNFAQPCAGCRTMTQANTSLSNANTVLKVKLETFERKIRTGKLVDPKALESAIDSAQALSDEDRDTMRSMQAMGRVTPRILTGEAAFPVEEIDTYSDRQFRAAMRPERK